MTNLIGYGEGLMNVATLPTYRAQLKKSQLDSLILAQFHITQDQIIFNDTLVVSSDGYVGDSAWPAMLWDLLGFDSSITTIGGSILGSWPDVLQIYTDNGNSFNDTQIQQNFQVLWQSIPAMTVIDMDVEETYDQPSFVAFCQMLIAIGYNITFCPYMSPQFWTASLAALQQSNPGSVLWWNLQCYNGGQQNNPKSWAAAIEAAIPNFSAASYIIAGDWTFPPRGDCPVPMQKLLAKFARQSNSGLGGAFLWTLDNIFNNQASSDPQTCSDTVAGLQDYMNAMIQGLQGKSP